MAGSAPPPIADADIIQIDLLNSSTVLLLFSDGSSLQIEAEKVKRLALTDGTGYVPDVHADPE